MPCHTPGWSASLRAWTSISSPPISAPCAEPGDDQKFQASLNGGVSLSKRLELLACVWASALTTHCCAVLRATSCPRIRPHLRAQQCSAAATTSTTRICPGWNTAPVAAGIPRCVACDQHRSACRMPACTWSVDEAENSYELFLGGLNYNHRVFHSREVHKTWCNTSSFTGHIHRLLDYIYLLYTLDISPQSDIQPLGHLA